MSVHAATALMVGIASLTGGVCAAEEKLPANVKTYFDRVAGMRVGQMSVLNGEIKVIERDLKKSRNREESQLLRARLDVKKDKLANLRKGELPNPTIDAINLSIDDIGHFQRGCTFVVEQIIDESTMHVTPILGLPNDLDDRGDRLVVRGLSTRELVDGKKVSLPGVFEVSGTEKYQTVLGADKTVFVVRPIDVDKYQATYEELVEPLRVIEWRMWKDTTGKFAVEAELAGIKDDVATLRKRDGSSVDVPLSRLSSQDRAFIRGAGE